MADFQLAEELLASKQAAKQNPMLLTMLKGLDEAVVYSQSGNADTNRKLWNNYSLEWSSSSDWAQRIASGSSVELDAQSVLGEEWAPKTHTLEIIQEFICPYLTSSDMVVAEIGVGGGRIAKEVVGSVGHLHAYDISQAMLKRAKETLAASQSSVSFHLVQADDLRLRPASETAMPFFDFIYSFDVFPHVDSHVLFAYLKEIKRTLKPGAKAFFSTADITSPGGFDRFSKQRAGTVGGFCFTSPDAVIFLVGQAGLKVVKRGERRDDNIYNVYLHRDLLLVVEHDV